ncbi:protein phosphatase 2C 37-like [Spinacia oleracea]|uniref:Protein phosphatase 2C 37-like n=1 Tax=Spinacia oleracea TaxID=3562 RepID=A0ABM3RI85_SPIOL|nr:protein phosphatase 2C 37-like [Spinacia oleracea]
MVGDGSLEAAAMAAHLQFHTSSFNLKLLSPLIHFNDQYKKALEEDPSVFDYDGVYDDIKSKMVQSKAEDRQQRQSAYKAFSNKDFSRDIRSMPADFQKRRELLADSGLETLSYSTELRVKEENIEWTETMSRSFKLMDSEVGERTKNNTGPTTSTSCRCELQTPQCDAVGSTTVVSVVTPEKIVVSNSGDSRDVLCRKGVAIPLSSNHKVEVEG